MGAVRSASSNVAKVGSVLHGSCPTYHNASCKIYRTSSTVDRNMSGMCMFLCGRLRAEEKNAWKGGTVENRSVVRLIASVEDVPDVLSLG